MNRVDSFKEWVAEEYQRRGWSMNELARRIGYSSGGVSKALAPGGDITWDFAAALADAFGMPAVEVFRKAGLLPARTETAERVAEAVSRLQDADQLVVLRIAHGLAQAPPEVRRVAERATAYTSEQAPAGAIDATDQLFWEYKQKEKTLTPEQRERIEEILREVGPITEEETADIAEAATSRMSADIVYRFLEERDLLGELEQELRRRESGSDEPDRTAS